MPLSLTQVAQLDRNTTDSHRLVTAEVIATDNLNKNRGTNILVPLLSAVGSC